MHIPFIKDDGGRAAAGYKGMTGDCVTRAIAIASLQPYEVVYNELHRFAREYYATSRSRHAKRIKGGPISIRNGVIRPVYEKYLLWLGAVWVPTMQVGSGCKVHVRQDELPLGRLVLSLSGHLAAVIDGTLHDTHDCSRGGTRCVYGYYIFKTT